VYLTERGWEVYETQWEAMQKLEDEWSAIVGRKKFEDFMEVLRLLASLDSKKGPAEQDEGIRKTRRR
jgi:hypothetical protein